MRRRTVVFILVALCLLGFAVVTRNTNTVPTSPRPTVSANATSITTGGSVTISWKWPSWGAAAATRDFIGIYEDGAANTSVVNAKFTSSCTRTAGAKAKASGSCSFTMPTTPGTYQFRLLNGSAVVVATSSDITVTCPHGQPACGPTVTTNVSSVPPGESVTVNWTGVSRPAPKDWLGLYTPLAPNRRAFLDWKFTSSCTRTAGATAKASGSCSFTMPTTPGTYQFRLFADNSYIYIATSPNLTVS